MGFSMRVWAQSFCISQSTVDILTKEGLTEPQLIRTLSQEDVRNLCSTLGQQKALQCGVDSLKETPVQTVGKMRSRVFCVYTKDREWYIEQDILPLLPQHLNKISLLHRDAIAGEDIFKFIYQHLSDQDTSVLVFFTHDMEKCQLCEEVLMQIPYFRKEQRFIPIILDGCTLPTHLSMTSSLEVGAPNFKERLQKSLAITNNGLSREDYKQQPVGKVLLDELQEPLLSYKERPHGPLKVFGKSGKTWRFQKSQFTDQWDNKVVIRKRNDTSKLSQTSVALEVVNCVQHMKNGRNCNLDADSLARIIRIFEIKATIADPKNIQNSNEHAFGLRVCHPQNVRMMTMRIAARLLQNRSGQSSVLYEAIMEFDTSEVNKPMERKKKKKQRLKGKVYDGDIDDTEDIDQQSTSERKSLTKNTLQKKSNNGNDLPQQISRCLNGRVRGLGILLKKDVRQMMFNLEQLADDNESDGFHPFYTTCDNLINDFKAQKRWSECVLVIIKQSGVDHYRNKYSQAKSHLKEVWKILDTCDVPDRDLLEGRALYYQSAIYREMKKFGKAEKCIDASIKALGDREYGDDTAKAFYNKGKLYLKMMQSGTSSDCTHFRQLIFDQFGKAVDHFTLSKTGVDLKQVRRCLLNMSTVKADCPFSKLGSQHAEHLSLHQLKTYTIAHVTLPDLNQAEGYLNDILGRYWSDEVPRRNHMQILKSRAEVGLCKALYLLVNEGQQDTTFSSSIGDVILKLKESNIIGMNSGFKESETTSKLISLLTNLKPESVENERYIIEMGNPSDPDFLTGSLESESNSDGQCHGKNMGLVSSMKGNGLSVADSSFSDSSVSFDDDDYNDVEAVTTADNRVTATAVADDIVAAISNNSVDSAATAAVDDGDAFKQQITETDQNTAN